MTKKISESTLKSLSSPESFARGLELYQSNEVFDTFEQVNLLTGKGEATVRRFINCVFN